MKLEIAYLLENFDSFWVAFEKVICYKLKYKLYVKELMEIEAKARRFIF